MESLNWVELIGYVASLLVAASLMMSNVARLRWINLFGSAVFSTYGAIVGAWPVFAVNLFVSCVDVYYLVQMRSRKDFFTMLPLDGVEPFERKFVRFHLSDIEKFFPDFRADDTADHCGFFVLRNLLPVGLVVYKAEEDGNVQVLLDYVIPEYRDRKNAEFVYRILNEQLSAKGLRQLVVRSRVEAHRSYLMNQGFEPASDDAELFRKQII